MDVQRGSKDGRSDTNKKSLTDLPVTDEQSDSTKGGGRAAIAPILGGALGTGAR